MKSHFKILKHVIFSTKIADSHRPNNEEKLKEQVDALRSGLHDIAGSKTELEEKQQGTTSSAKPKKLSILLPINKATGLQRCVCKCCVQHDEMKTVVAGVSRYYQSKCQIRRNSSGSSNVKQR